MANLCLSALKGLMQFLCSNQIHEHAHYRSTALSSVRVTVLKNSDSACLFHYAYLVRTLIQKVRALGSYPSSVR